MIITKKLMLLNYIYLIIKQLLQPIYVRFELNKCFLYTAYYMEVMNNNYHIFLFL